LISWSFQSIHGLLNKFALNFSPKKLSFTILTIYFFKTLKLCSLFKLFTFTTSFKYFIFQKFLYFLLRGENVINLQILCSYIWWTLLATHQMFLQNAKLNATSFDPILTSRLTRLWLAWKATKSKAEVQSNQRKELDLIDWAWSDIGIWPN